jgi:uncharacterized membrane protein
MPTESHARTLGKTLSWRFIAMVITAVLASLLAHDAKVGLTIGIADTLVKFVAYYLHERAWARVSVGYVEVVNKQGSGI